MGRSKQFGFDIGVQLPSESICVQIDRIRSAISTLASILSDFAA
jgi:hypothetical protein